VDWFYFLCAAIAVAFLLRVFSKPRAIEPEIDRSPDEVAQILESFINRTYNDCTLDDFIHVHIKDPYLESVRERVEHLAGDYLPRDGSILFPTAKVNVELRLLLDEVKSRAT